MIRKLPVGIQDFERLRTEGYLYVDKTELVYKIASTSVPYFLSRPRRFGKSILISTFEAYFQGRKELFEGLAIEKLETEWIQYPVLHLDLNAKKYATLNDLLAILTMHLEKWELDYGNEMAGRSPEERFAYLIRRACEQTGKKVVILIDEYDKPLLQTILNEPLMEEYRRTLKAFYGVLKSSDRYLRFVFITGVTKFAQVSVFSDLNQLNDISMKPPYITACGITHDELIRTFTPEIEQLGQTNGMTFEETVHKLTSMYDGYHFCENAEGLFNPFSLLNVFDGGKFDNYWFQTGTPTYLVDLLKKSDYDLRRLIDGVQLDSSAFAEYRLETNNPIPMIYQSGYLTIKDYDRRFEMYTLGFPNEEVKYGFLNFLAPSYMAVPDDQRRFHIGRFTRELETGEVDSFMERVCTFFADFPYELNDKTERHYQVVFYLIFKLMGQFIDAEVRSAKGRADAVVRTKDYLYVFEFKLNGTAEEALAQIDEKGYLLPYAVDARQLVKVGVEFSKEERNVSRYLVRGL